MYQTSLKHLWRAAVRLIDAASTVLVVVTTLSIVTKLVIGEQWELVAILNSILHLLLIGSLLVLIARVIQRRWRLVAIACLPGFYFVAVYGVAFLPDRVLSASDDMPDIRVMTYNIHSEKTLLQPVVDLILEANPDVVAIQELSVEAAAYFENELSDSYPFQAFHTFVDNPIPGQGVLSRFPVTDDRYWRNDFLPKQLGHQRVEINVNSVGMTMYNAHPIHPIMQAGRLFNVSLRTQEIQSVLDRALEDNGPVLIVGDFNMADQSEDYQRMTEHFGDTYRDAGWGLGFTFPDFSSRNAVPGHVTALPVRLIVRLDYLFYNKAFQPLNVRVWGASGGSDHRPVIAEYRFTGQEP